MNNTDKSEAQPTGHSRLVAIDAQAQAALNSRTTWENKQLDFYRLRHGTKERLNKPFPQASSLNWPLADTLIEKIKPYYIQQVFANELLANFYALKRDLSPFNNLAAQWFDYRLRQRTNFEFEVISLTDYMLVAGKGVLKIYWCEDEKQVRFDAIDPMFFLVPAGTVSLEDTDWCIQVHHVSVDAYKRNKNWNQDPEFVRRIVTNNNLARTGTVSEDKLFREGLTHASSDRIIVLWEYYGKDSDSKVTTATFSPLVLDAFVREERPLPYDHGCFPFVEFNAEIKDKGFYASRGVPERVAALQNSMTRMWNEKMDSLAYFLRPMFVSESPLGNVGSLPLRPGTVLPYSVRKVEMGQPPISWDIELSNHRMTAEQLVGVPDAGLTQQFKSNERRTASEVNLIGSLMSQVVDLRSRVFRKSLATVFRQAWQLYVQHDKKSLDYFFRNELMSVPPDAMSDDYRIEPLASADNFNKQFVYQKKLSRFQMLQNNPYVNQAELVRDMIAADDPQDVKRLFMDGQTQALDQAEDQAGEIARMLIGFPSQVKPVDDDVTHLMTLRQFVERRLLTGEMISGELALLLVNHANMHFQQLVNKDKNAAAQLEPQMQQMSALLGKIVGEAQAAAQAALAPQAVSQETQM